MNIHVDQSPVFLTSDDFIRSNEVIRTKWPNYVVCNQSFCSNNLMISSERVRKVIDLKV